VLNAITHKDLREIADADVIMARGVEMLAIAATVRRRFARTASLVYECLDIHKVIHSQTLVGKALRAVEGYLLTKCSLLIISSPGYERNYFEPHYGKLPPVYIVENKILEQEQQPETTIDHLSAPPWRIGWFGRVRCRKSLHILARLALRYPGQVEIVIRGRPDKILIPEFDEVVAATPGVEYYGPYDRATDLAAIYQDVHIAWMLDFFDGSNNSGEWCLVNRMYEAGSNNSVLMGLRDTESGHWLTAKGVGIVVDAPIEESLDKIIETMSPESYLAAKAAIRQLPRYNFVCYDTECRALVTALSAS
jgi:succinoglycan biosynthesis protein ExoL